ncbi:MAG TPA: hypothetical protein VGJ84_09690, partial [Polyangiaceae bacterium]
PTAAAFKKLRRFMQLSVFRKLLGKGRRGGYWLEEPVKFAGSSKRDWRPSPIARGRYGWE